MIMQTTFGNLMQQSGATFISLMVTTRIAMVWH